jgi:hypothetical protein
MWDVDRKALSVGIKWSSLQRKILRESRVDELSEANSRGSAVH